MEFEGIGMHSFAVLGVGAALSFILPILAALIWKLKKKERFTTILAGAATFLLFAILLEKPIQNALLFPTQMGLAETSLNRFVNARPVLLALLLGLFPGVFEETGRLVTYKTVLKKRKNRETSISCGIGHGGMEVILIMGSAYISYIAYAVMINAGTFGSMIEQVAAKAPDQAASYTALAAQLPAIAFTDIGAGFAERLFAFLFHIGASILVFYACRDKGKVWLYPFAIILHTAMDFMAGLYAFGILRIPVWALEGMIAVFSILVLCGAYFLLYKKDADSSVPVR